MARGILVHLPGIEPTPSAVRVWSPNYWTNRGFPCGHIFKTSIGDYAGLRHFGGRRRSLKAEGRKLQGLKYEAAPSIRLEPQVVPKVTKVGRCYNMKGFLPHGKEFALLSCSG